MTAIDCRYGKGANFELTKACLTGQDPRLSPPLNFARHFARVQNGEKVQSKQGQHLLSETSPQYFRRHDAAWQLLQDKVKHGTSGPAQSSASGTNAGNGKKTSFAASDTPSPQVPEWSVALMSGALAIGVAIVAGMALSGGIQKAGLPHLGGAASGRLADGPILNPAPIVPASLPASLPPAVSNTPAMPEPVSPPAEVDNSSSDAAAPSASPPPVKKKKHKKARAEKGKKPSRSNPFTGNQPAYSASLPSSTLAKVIECNRITSLLRHELCMWQACKNKWGRDGCPSYNNSATSGQMAGIIRH